MANIISFWLHICASVPFFWHGTRNVSTGTTGRSLEWFFVSQGIPEVHTAKLQLQPCQSCRVSFNLTLSATKHRVEICGKKGFNKRNIFRLGWTSCHKSYVDSGILRLGFFSNCSTVTLTPLCSCWKFLLPSFFPHHSEC